jgi:hypothetical protein
MVNRRPAPELIAARKWEIARRYSKKAKVGKRSRSMAAIRLSELTRWLDDAYDAYGAGVELEPSATSETILRVFAHHLGGLPDAPRRISAWCDRYTPWLTLRSREILIGEVVACPLKYSADKLAWKIRLTDAKRTELKIKTIGAIDCSKEQRADRRRSDHAKRQKAARVAKRQAVRNI